MDRQHVPWRLFITAVALGMLLGIGGGLRPASVAADITCYDFVSQAEAQAVFDALPGDPYKLDTGWPPSRDQEAGKGLPCDADEDIPELENPGDEEYSVNDDSAKNGLEGLPDEELEEATIRDIPSDIGVQIDENPSKLYVIMGIATPEFELFRDYEDNEVLAQCGAAAATARLRELLAPGIKVWLEVDEAGFYIPTQLDRHLWIELDGRYRLVSEVLVTEGHAVVATERPGTGGGDARENPPPGVRYRDALRQAQVRAIEARMGLWEQCAPQA